MTCPRRSRKLPTPVVDFGTRAEARDPALSMLHSWRRMVGLARHAFVVGSSEPPRRARPTLQTAHRARFGCVSHSSGPNAAPSARSRPTES